jgi:hypothetical protein
MTATVAHTNGKTPPKPVKAAASAKAKPAPAPIAASVETAGSATIAIAFAQVVHAIRTMAPQKASTKTLAAMDYYGSSAVAAIAEAWRGKAKKTAIALGVLPNYEAEPFDIGTAETVYTDAFTTISLRVTPQAPRVDVDGLVADLEAAGIKPALLKRLLKKHTRTFAGAHVFTASLAV